MYGEKLCLLASQNVDTCAGMLVLTVELPIGRMVTRGQDLTGKDFSGLDLTQQDFKTVLCLPNQSHELLL